MIVAYHSFVDHYDVAVVGAGPAGSSAAALLAKRRSVLVIDKACFPRDKCCGDGLTAAALRRLSKLGLRVDALPSWQAVSEVFIRSPSGRTISLNLPAMAAHAGVVRRTDLDAALLYLARTSGADVRDGTKIQDAAESADHNSVVLHPEFGDPISADFVIAADGAWSQLRKATSRSSTRTYLGEWHAFRQYFSGVSGHANGAMCIWLDEDLLPGYAWSFPLPESGANVGYAIKRRPGLSTGRMADQWNALLARQHIRDALGELASAEAPRKAWPIPANMNGANLVALRGRILFVGDAARVADPLTGEGIAQALQSADAAASAILANSSKTPHAVARDYASAMRRGIGRDQAASRFLSGVLRHPTGARAAVRVAGLSRRGGSHFVRWLFEDYPRSPISRS